MSRSGAIAVGALIFACRSAGLAPVPVTGAWVGAQGPNPERPRPGARLELLEDGGTVLGVWYSPDPVNGTLQPIGILTGTRDGGTLALRNLAAIGEDGGIVGGTPFTARLTSPDHLEALVNLTRRDGGPLPVYLKLDRTAEPVLLRWAAP